LYCSFLFQFAWFKDNNPLTASNRLRPRYDVATNEVLLQISDVRPEDVGQYLVVASNPAGKDSTTAKLSILPVKGIDDRAFLRKDEFRNLERPEEEAKVPMEIKPSAIPEEEKVPEEKRPPRVLEKLKDYVVEESMPVILTTKIDAGVPKASVRFQFYSFLTKTLGMNSHVRNTTGVGGITAE
jgi:Immunoglobulin I-set domain